MKHYLTWKLESFYALLQFIAAYSFISTDISDLADDVSDLEDATAEIEGEKGIQESPTKGVTTATKAKKLLMAKTVIAKAHKGRAKARRAQEWDLYAKVNYEVSYILKAPKLDAVTRAKNIQKVLVDNATVFTNIKPTDKTAMTDAIAAYDAVKLAPRGAIETRKAQSTEAYELSFKKAQTAADSIYDLIYGEYVLSNPNLVKELKLVCGIAEEGVRHNTIHAVCSDGNPPQGAITALLEGVRLLIVELNKTAVSDINGVVTLAKFTQGTYHVEFSKEGYVTQTMIIHVGQGETVELEVEMVRVV
ncbi:MAG: PEGA domain-containing protein [Bacillota bacterium]